MIFFTSFLVVYFSDITGYYQYQNYKKTTLTLEQIKKFEEDVASGKEIDINEYLINYILIYYISNQHLYILEYLNKENMQIYYL